MLARAYTATTGTERASFGTRLALAAIKDLRVTLVWTDPVPSYQSFRRLVNNLDLRVQDSKGNLYLGNQVSWVLLRAVLVLTLSVCCGLCCAVSGTGIPYAPTRHAVSGTLAAYAPTSLLRGVRS